MVFVASVVFLVIFAAVILLFALVGGSREQKQIRERLESIHMAARRGPLEEGLNILREEVLSNVPAFNRLLLRLDLFPPLRRLLAQAEMRWTLGGFLLLSAACGLAAGVAAYWRTAAWPFAVLLGVTAAGAPLGYVLFQRSRRFAEFEEKLPQALDLMVNAMRAGHSLITALEMVAREIPPPIGDEFKKCFDEQNFGLDLREALLNFADRIPLHDVQIMVTAILIQKETGGNLAEILEKVAEIIRERFRLKRQVRVHTAQGRLTGWILTLLPPVIGVGLYLMNPNHMSRLWKHPTGLKLMYASVLMTLIGGLIIRKIVRIRV
jgi:tight adherence protein B